MKNPSYLTVLEVSEPKLDKNKEKHYKKITVLYSPYITTVDVDNGDPIVVPLPTKQSAFIAYENNYLDKQDFGWNLVAGQKIAGSIVTRKVEPYIIEREDGKQTEPRTVASVIVLGDSTSEEFEIEIQKAFKAREFVLAGSKQETPNTTVVTKEQIRKGQLV